jgi:hypothetical protein
VQVRGLIAGDGGQALIFVAAGREQGWGAYSDRTRPRLAHNGTSVVFLATVAVHRYGTAEGNDAL